MSQFSATVRTVPAFYLGGRLCHRIGGDVCLMVYTVSCSVCEFDAEVEGLDAVFELQEEHRSEAGERHLLEFEKV